MRDNEKAPMCRRFRAILLFPPDDDVTSAANAVVALMRG